jgi:hypothetical protein
VSPIGRKLSHLCLLNSGTVTTTVSHIGRLDATL